MLLVVGLGNPGARYAATRHNIGFEVVDALAGPAAGWRAKFDGFYCQLEAPDRAILLKPQTYMNLSGRSVAAAAGFFKTPAEAVLVVHDEVDLRFGTVRLKFGGGEAGHNGLRSISRELGTRDFMRVRVGVGRPPPNFSGEISDFVLQAFAPHERDGVGPVIESALNAVRLVMAHGLEAAMNQVNRKA